eukprot:9655854-Lingulodinium_polyedra.AAC.1
MARYRPCWRGLPEPGGRAPNRRAGACGIQSAVPPARGGAAGGWRPRRHAPSASQSMPRPEGREAHP